MLFRRSGDGDPVTKVGLLLVFAVVAAFSAPGASGTSKTALACGDVVLTNVVLEKSLKDCPASGLIVGADNITIDLNGRTIEGTRAEASVGVEAVGRSGITIKGGGRIRNFAVGVRLFDTGGSTVSDLRLTDTGTGILVAASSHASLSENQIVGDTITDSETGISLLGASPTSVVANRIAGLTGVGIFCHGPFGTPGVHIEGNKSVRNAIGIYLFFCGADLVNNEASHNSGTGILRTRSNGLVEQNVANDNGDAGIVADDSHGLFLGNTTNRNGGAGLSIVDQVAGHGPFHTVTGHEANGNGGLGISTWIGGALEGVIDGGGNKARHNGDPLQCVGVPCS